MVLPKAMADEDSELAFLAAGSPILKRRCRHEPNPFFFDMFEARKRLEGINVKKNDKPDATSICHIGEP